jgi:hypothetical protein
VAGFYLFRRQWPDATPLFPSERFNHLSDGEILPALLEAADELIQSHPDLKSKENVQRLRLVDRLPPPEFQPFYNAAIMAGWFRLGRAWLYYSATGYRFVVTPRSPLLWIPDLETATQTLAALKKEINRRVAAEWSKASVMLGGQPITGLTDEYVAALLPHFGILPSAEFGDVSDKVLIEADIDAARTQSDQNLSRLADKLFELVKRVQEREAARPDPGVVGVPQASVGVQQLVDQAACKPHWNKVRGDLLLGGRAIKHVQNIGQATNVVKVLDSFQEEGWPEKIDDPLDAGKLRETLRSLNENLTEIRFGGDGTGEGIRWTIL